MPPSLPSPSVSNGPTNVETAHDYVPPKMEHFDRPTSPLQMPPGQIDGLESLQTDSLLKERGQSPSRKMSNTSLLHLDIQRFRTPAEIAMSALQYLPYPLLVLDNMKTLVMANEAMGRLLGIDDDDGDTRSDDGLTPVDKLRGKTLSQLGIDMLSDGRPVWVTWDAFLDGIAEELGIGLDDPIRTPGADSESGGDTTPTAHRGEYPSQGMFPAKNTSMVHDSVVEVIISQDTTTNILLKKADYKHMYAKMIITIWEIEDDRFFTLTFTSTDTGQTSLPSSRGQSRQVKRVPKPSSNGSHSSPSSASSGQNSSHGGSSNSSAITSPTSISMSTSPFPPLGPPSKNPISSSASNLQRIIMMKDALLDNTETPILAMWKDGSINIPNKAARRLFQPGTVLTDVRDGYDLLPKWVLYDETFTRVLDSSEYPISVIVQTQKPFTGRKIGLIDPDTNEKVIFDCLGEAINDPITGEFLAGMVTCRDITKFTAQINEIKEKDEQRFQLICDSMPQMIWTTTPEGMHDWFSQRW